MSKNRIAPLLIAVVMLFGLVPSVAAETTVYAAVSYGEDYLTAGTLTAEVGVSEIGAAANRGFIAALLYCAADGGVIDFSAKKLETSLYNEAYGIYSAKASFQLEIPADVTEGQYAKAIVLDGVTLAPIAVSGGTIECVDNAETAYDGIFERYYTLDGADGSIAVDGSSVSVAAEGTPLRLKDMAEGYVAFENSENPKNRLCNKSGAAGCRIYGFGGESMLWKLVSAGEEYYVQSYDGGYLAVEGGEAVIGQEPYPFKLNFVRESGFTLMTSLEGFRLLPEDTRQRVIEICTSVGAEIFPNGTNQNSILDSAEMKFKELYADREGLTPEEQRDKILEIMQTPPSYNTGVTDEISSVTIENLPGGGAEISKSGVQQETLYIWDTGTKEYNRIDVTYTDTGFGESQSVKFYYDESGATNVQAAIEALAVFPYEYRKFIEQVNVYVPENTFTYNCNGTLLTVRVQDGTKAEAMARSFAHELGHSADFLANGADMSYYSAHWCQSEEWKQAVEKDLIIVSEYGNQFYTDPADEKYGKRNLCENFAEFARLYFQSYGNRDRQIGIRQLFPNQFASFERMLDKIGMEQLF